MGPVQAPRCPSTLCKTERRLPPPVTQPSRRARTCASQGVGFGADHASCSDLLPLLPTGMADPQCPPERLGAEGAGWMLWSAVGPGLSGGPAFGVSLASLPRLLSQDAELSKLLGNPR